jgi:O-antigen/teichoic acid export membrane protein
MGVLGVLLGNAIGAGVVAGAFLWTARGDFRGSFSPKLLREILAFGLPLIPTTVSFWVLQVSDRYFLEHMAHGDEVGHYALANRVSDLLRFAFILPFSTAWGAYCIQIAAQQDGRALAGRISGAYLAALCALGSALVIVAPVAIGAFADPSYGDSIRVVAPLVYGNALYGAAHVLNLGLVVAKRTKTLAAATGIGALVNLLLNLLWIPRYGMDGAAYATVVSYFVVAVATWRSSSRLYAVPLPWRSLVPTVAGCSALVAISLTIPPGGGAKGALISAGLALGCLGLPFLAKAIPFPELRRRLGDLVRASATGPEKL